MANITADFIGRNLHITVGDLPPFVIHPLPGGAGLQMTDTYLKTASQQASPEEMTQALAIAIDGAVKNEDGIWEPRPVDERVNANRMDDELSIGETEDVAMVALFWQTVLNDDGVRIYLAAGGGVEGHTKALGALALRSGLSLSMTSPLSELDALTPSPASTPSTSSLPDGVKPGRRPLDRLPKMLGGKSVKRSR